MRGGNDFGHGGHADQVRANHAQIANLGGRFVTRPGERGVDALGHLDAQPLPFLQRGILIWLPIHLRHVWKAHAEAVLVRTDQRIGALEIDVVAQDNQASLLKSEIDPARGVGNQDGADSYPGHHAHRENHFVRRVALVRMHASLHHRHRYVSHFADDHAPRVPDRRGMRKVRNLLVVEARGVSYFVRERAQAAAQHQSDARTQLGFSENEFCGAFGAHKILAGFRLRRSGFTHFRNIPTMDADIRFAMVPASMARMPNFASCDF